MLEISLTTLATGVVIKGNDVYLEKLYDELQSVAPVSIDGGKVNGIKDGRHVSYALDFCYEIRKTFTGCREVITGKNKSNVYKTKIILPLFLVYLRLFKHFAKAADKPTHLLDKLIADFTVILMFETTATLADEVKRFITMGTPFNHDYHFNVAELSYYHYLLEKSKKKRLAYLSQFVIDMSAKSAFYRNNLSAFKGFAKENCTDIKRLESPEYKALIREIYGDGVTPSTYKW